MPHLIGAEQGAPLGNSDRQVLRRRGRLSELQRVGQRFGTITPASLDKVIELTALKWINITGRGRFAEIAPAQLGGRTIQVGDHVLIDGAEKRITGIEFVDYVSPRVANLALLLSDPP